MTVKADGRSAFPITVKPCSFRLPFPGTDLSIIPTTEIFFPWSRENDPGVPSPSWRNDHDRVTGRTGRRLQHSPPANHCSGQGSMMPGDHRAGPGNAPLSLFYTCARYCAFFIFSNYVVSGYRNTALAGQPVYANRKPARPIFHWRFRPCRPWCSAGVVVMMTVLVMVVPGPGNCIHHAEGHWRSGMRHRSTGCHTGYGTRSPMAGDCWSSRDRKP